jgi:hypothetical protein
MKVNALGGHGAAPIEMRSALTFLNAGDKSDFITHLGLGTPSTLAWTAVTGKPQLHEFLPAITYPSGGAGCLDSVNCSTAGYTAGKIISFADGIGNSWCYELVDDTVLPSGDGFHIVLPLTAFGTKYWSIRSSQVHTEGSRSFSIPGELYAGSFYGSGVGLTSIPAANLTGAVGASCTIAGPRITSGVVSQNRLFGGLFGMPDSNYPFSGDTFAAGNGGIYTITLTASRTYNLPSVSAYPAGELYVMFDAGMQITTSRTVTLLRDGTDTINGATSITLDVTGGRIVLRSLGSGKWQGWNDTPGGLSSIHLGSVVQAYDSDLAALAANGSNGLWVRTGAGTGAARTLVAGSTKLSITNGDGVASNPSFDVAEANLTLQNLGGQVPLATKVSGTLPVANGGTGITALGTGIAAFLGTPSSANLATAVTDETGAGGSHLLVFNQNPTLNGITVTGGNAASVASSNAATLQGTGSATAKITSAASTVIEATSSAQITVVVNGATRFTFNTSGHFTPNSTNTADLGASTLAMREIFVRTLDTDGANDLVLQRNNVTICTLQSTGLTMALPIRFKGYTVAGLPAGTQGDNAFVTDALAPTYNATVAGGGAVIVPVFHNGTNWTCH